MIKYLLITTVLVCYGTSHACEDVDSGMPTPWELLVLKPDERNGQRIQIDGYLKIDSTSTSILRVQLFSDLDSLNHDRNFKFIELDCESFLKSMSSLDFEDIIGMNKKFISIKGRFQKKELLDPLHLQNGQFSTGGLSGPYLIAYEKAIYPLPKK